MEIIRWSRIKDINKDNIDELTDEFDFKLFRKKWNLRHKDVAFIFGVSIKAVEKMEQENSTHTRNIGRALMILNDIELAFDTYNKHKNEINLDVIFNNAFNLKNYKDINERPYLKLHYINSKTKENSYSVFDYTNFENSIVEVIGMSKNGLSANKLSKLVYLLDYNHLQEHGQTFTGCTYRKFSNGPMIEGIHELLEYFEMNGKLRSIENSEGHKIYFSNLPSTYADVIKVINKYLSIDFIDIDKIIKENTTFTNTSVLEHLLIQKS